MLFSCGKCKQKVDADTIPASGICGACVAFPDLSKFVSLDDHTKLKGEHDKVLGEYRNLKAEKEAHGRSESDGGNGGTKGAGDKSGDSGKGKKGKADRFHIGTVFNLFADDDEDEVEEKKEDGKS